MSKAPHIACGVLMLLAGFGARGQAQLSDHPAAQLGAWLLKEKLAGVPDGGLQDRLLRVEAHYSDGASYAAAGLAGSWLAAGLPSDTPAQLADNLRYLLAASLAREQAVPGARNLLLELVLRRPPSPFRRLAFRKLIDLALDAEDFEGVLRPLEGYSPTEAEKDELTYLKARALHRLGYPQQAREALATISPLSRFKPAALYLLGVLALEEGNEQAEDFFCQIVNQPAQGKFTFMLSRHSEEIIRRAWLALARLRHDRGDYQRTLDAYRQVADAGRQGQEARWEAAWAFYRMERYRDCLDLLEQLGLTGNSVWSARSLLLRGYALVGQCEFEQAQQVFDKALDFLAEFGLAPPPPEAAHVLAPPDPDYTAGPERQTLMVQRQAGVNYRRWLYLQSALWRLLSGFWFRWTSPVEEELAVALDAHLARSRGLLQRARALQARVADQATSLELDQLFAQALAAHRRLEEQAEKLSAHRLRAWPQAAEDPTRLPAAYLRAEQRGLLALAPALQDLLRRSRAATDAARAAGVLEVFRQVRQQARLAELGKVDAQMGRKQALEIEIENLALGHYPLSLYRLLSAAGQLGPDTEYWPYDGEGWPDELEKQ